MSVLAERITSVSLRCLYQNPCDMNVAGVLQHDGYIRHAPIVTFVYSIISQYTLRKGEQDLAYPSKA